MTRLIWLGVAACVLASCDRPADESQAAAKLPRALVRQADPDASAMLDRIQAAYVEADGIEVRSNATLIRGPSPIRREAFLQIGPDATLRWEAPGVAMEIRDGMLLAEIDTVTDRVVAVPAEGTPLAAVERVLGETAPPPAVLLLQGGADTTRWLDVLTGGVIGRPVATGHRLDTDGGLLIDLAGTRGTGFLRIDPATMWVRSAEAESNNAMQTKSSAVRYSVSYDTTAIRLPGVGKHIVVGNRSVVPTIEALVRTSHQRERVDIGAEVPDFRLPRTDGGDVTRSSLRGSIVVLDFWARWCGPCRAGLPEIQRLYEATGRNADGVLVFGVNVQDGGDLKRVQEFWAKASFGFPSLVAGDGEIGAEWGIDGIPVTIVIGPDGTVLERVDGYISGEWKHLAEVIEAFSAAMIDDGRDERSP